MAEAAGYEEEAALWTGGCAPTRYEDAANISSEDSFSQQQSRRMQDEGIGRDQSDGRMQL